MMMKLYILYDIFKVLIKGLPKPVGASIDITNRCNLKCKHCYFWRQNYQAELDDNNWLNKLKDLKNQYKNLLQASWCGICLAGFLVIMVINQSGRKKGCFPCKMRYI